MEGRGGAEPGVLSELGGGDEGARADGGEAGDGEDPLEDVQDVALAADRPRVLRLGLGVGLGDHVLVVRVAGEPPRKVIGELRPAGVVQAVGLHALDRGGGGLLGPGLVHDHAHDDVSAPSPSAAPRTARVASR